MPLELLTSCLLFFFLYKGSIFYRHSKWIGEHPRLPLSVRAEYRCVHRYLCSCLVGHTSADLASISHSICTKTDSGRERADALSNGVFRDRFRQHIYHWIRDAWRDGDVDRSAIFRCTFCNDCDPVDTYPRTDRFPYSLNNLYRTAPQSCEYARHATHRRAKFDMVRALFLVQQRQPEPPDAAST